MTEKHHGLPDFLRKLMTKVVEPTTFDVVPAELSVAGPSPVPRERPERSSNSHACAHDIGNNWYMDPTEFLARRVPGYANLDGDERHAIAEFSLLWPAFEGAILETAASPSGLVQIGFKLRDAGRLDMARFDVPLAYFRNRYWRDGAFTPEYDGLHLKHFNQRNQKLVRETLSNVPLLPEDVLGGLLLVVYRLRNNLFHGVKWAYGIKGQRPNFQNACVVLMAVMELHEGLN